MCVCVIRRWIAPEAADRIKFARLSWPNLGRPSFIVFRPEPLGRPFRPRARCQLATLSAHIGKLAGLKYAKLGAIVFVRSAGANFFNLLAFAGAGRAGRRKGWQLAAQTDESENEPIGTRPGVKFAKRRQKISTQAPIFIHHSRARAFPSGAKQRRQQEPRHSIRRASERASPVACFSASASARQGART